jgi:uncharacterized phage infection (PIP) family protein YhgE
MIFLEIAMIVIGLAAVIYSVRLSESKKEEEKEDTLVPIVDTAVFAGDEEKQLQEMLEDFTQKAEAVFEDLDDRMSQMSNEKIMGMSEYSEQVLDKIEKNHEEVVFLYDMMNEKQEEIKRLVHDVDSVKADFHDETAKEYQKMKEQEKQFDEMKKAIELELLEFQSAQGKIRQELEQQREEAKADDMLPEEDELDKAFDAALEDVDFESMEDFKELLEQDKEVLLDNTEQSDDSFTGSDAVSVYDAEIAKIEKEEADAARAENGQSDEMENHNEEIISLYKKGRSILEISKMLSLGQGEVKFVIDLYNAR